MIDPLERTVGQVVAAGAVPIVLGGDRSIAERVVREMPTGTAVRRLRAGK